MSSDAATDFITAEKFASDVTEWKRENEVTLWGSIPKGVIWKIVAMQALKNTKKEIYYMATCLSAAGDRMLTFLPKVLIYFLPIGSFKKINFLSVLRMSSSGW